MRNISRAVSSELLSRRLHHRRRDIAPHEPRRVPSEHLGEVPARTAPDLEDGHALCRNLRKEGLDEAPTLVPIVGGVITCDEPTVPASPCSLVGDLGPVLVRLVLGHATPPSRSSSTASLDSTIYVSRTSVPTAETSAGLPRSVPPPGASATHGRSPIESTSSTSAEWHTGRSRGMSQDPRGQPRRSSAAIVIRGSRCLALEAAIGSRCSTRRSGSARHGCPRGDAGLYPGRVHRPSDAGRTGRRPLELDVHVHWSPVRRPVMTAWSGSWAGAATRWGS